MRIDFFAAERSIEYLTAAILAAIIGAVCLVCRNRKIMQRVSLPFVIPAVAYTDSAFIQIEFNERGDAFVRTDIITGFFEFFQIDGIGFDECCCKGFRLGG